MNPSIGQHARLAFTFSLVISVVLGAAGLSVEVLNGFNSDLNRFNQTNLIAFVASGGGLACSMLALRGAKILPSLGIALVLIAAALQTAIVWNGDYFTHGFRQVTWSVSIFAFACGHAAALRLARLSPGQRWAMIVAQTLIVAVAVLSAWRVYFDLPWTPEIDRAHWILIILDVAMTALIPFFHWSSKAFFERERLFMRRMIDEEFCETGSHRRRDKRIRSYYDASIQQ